MLADGTVGTPLDPAEVARASPRELRDRAASRPSPSACSTLREPGPRAPGGRGSCARGRSRSVAVVALERRGPGDPRVRAHLHDAAPTSTCSALVAALPARPRRPARAGSASPAGCSSCSPTAASARVETARRFPIRLHRVRPRRRRPGRGALRRAASAATTCSPSTWAAPPPRLCVIEDGEPLIAPRVRGRPRATASRRAAACPIKVPVIEMIEIGAGGGSHRPRRRAGPAQGRAGQRGRRARARPATAAAAPSRP